MLSTVDGSYLTWTEVVFRRRKLHCGPWTEVVSHATRGKEYFKIVQMIVKDEGY